MPVALLACTLCMHTYLPKELNNKAEAAENCGVEHGGYRTVISRSRKLPVIIAC